MAKKKASTQRSDAERRARQCQRLARVLRALQCVSGPGRWDADGLAKELECSVRTVHRILTTLTMAGVPFRYDAEARAYKVPLGYKFPGLDARPPADAIASNPGLMLPAAKRALKDAERLAESLRSFCDAMESKTDSPS